MSAFFSHNKNAAGQGNSTTSIRIFYAAGMLLGGLLILFAARGDLWLDEIWSVFIAEAARTPWEIISVYKHDNNHVLNTLYLYLLGKQEHLLFYRLFSIVSGIASLVLLVKIAQRWGRFESIFVLLLAGTSYPLILYFSEARGYAPAIFFGLLSFYIIQESQNHYSPVKLVSFWIISILGTLAHLTFVIVFLALVIYIIHYEFSTGKTFFMKSWQILKYLFVPFVFIASFYFYFVKGMAIGGGPPIDRYSQLVRGINCLLGLPDALWYVGLLILVLLLSVVVYMLYADKSPIWSFSLAVLIIVPAAIIIITNPEYFHYRYLIVCFPFYYLVMAFVLARAYRADKKMLHYFAMIVIILYVMGQSYRLVPFFQYGRGSYQPIVIEMENASSSDIITVGSDNDFRNKMVLSFYSRFLQNQKKIQYIDQQFWNSDPPEWMIVHSLDESAKPESWIQTATDKIYRLVKTEKFSGDSGFNWFLYHDSNKQVRKHSEDKT
jgi:hypothetical protein